ncbi:hypothetical protein GVAV_000891 [Gurleya vavrai]
MENNPNQRKIITNPNNYNNFRLKDQNRLINDEYNKKTSFNIYLNEHLDIKINPIFLKLSKIMKAKKINKSLLKKLFIELKSEVTSFLNFAKSLIIDKKMKKQMFLTDFTRICLSRKFSDLINLNKHGKENTNFYQEIKLNVLKLSCQEIKISNQNMNEIFDEFFCECDKATDLLDNSNLWLFIKRHFFI